MASKTPSPSYKLQTHSAVTFINNSHATKQRTKNNKTVANPMSASACGTSTLSGTFVEKSCDTDASKNSDDEDDEDEGTLIQLSRWVLPRLPSLRQPLKKIRRKDQYRRKSRRLPRVTRAKTMLIQV